MPNMNLQRGCPRPGAPEDWRWAFKDMRYITTIALLLLSATSCLAEDIAHKYRISQIGREFITHGRYRITLIDIEKPYDRKEQKPLVHLGPLESNTVVTIDARQYTVTQIGAGDNGTLPTATLIDEDGHEYILKSINEGDLDVLILPDNKLQFHPKKNE